MVPIKQVIGIDISMDTFICRVGIITADQRTKVGSHQVFNNNNTGVRRFYKFALSQQIQDIPQYFLMEATGVYYETLAYFLKSQGAHVIVVLPNKAKHFAKTLTIKSKTDPIDAHMLTQMGLEKRLSEWEPPSELMKELKLLTREHLSLKELRTDAKNRIHAKTHSFKPGKDTIKRLKQQITLYERHIKQVEICINTLLKRDQQTWDKIENILTVNGIGLMTIAKVLAETNAFALIRNGKQLTSYAGLDVVLRESGKHRGKTIISKKGNRHLRMSVYMPAISAIKSNPQMKTYYDRMLERGKPKKAGVVAVARKLLLLIYYLWLNETPYDPAYSA
ncbi:MAG: IS110 family transposase [FCB group bacterium]|nr:IS110 family transposase [FCB group bacterium]MBL7028283.1 IS110 family transposase [Candidatus Neomarinimicrobiota bacterium]MBL7121602.1 IS110 family transposase [Candidatus Neomarinimicrobiota bacterium]